MKLQVGDLVVFDDPQEETSRTIHYGRIVSPEDKHEVRQCRTTKLVVVETIHGQYHRRVADQSTFHCKLTSEELPRVRRAGWPPTLSDLDLALRLSLN